MHRQRGMKAGQSPQQGESGMTLIELMIAMVVLAVGMGATMTLLMTAITSNSRSKFDTGGTLVAQMVLERIAAVPATLSPGPNITITDCNPSGPTTFTVATANGGATLADTTGNIDWTQSGASVQANYRMIYHSCATDAGSSVSYDVRWNVTRLNALTKLITVSVRPIATRSLQFSLPINLRSISGS